MIQQKYIEKHHQAFKCEMILCMKDIEFPSEKKAFCAQKQLPRVPINLELYVFIIRLLQNLFIFSPFSFNMQRQN